MHKDTDRRGFLKGMGAAAAMGAAGSATADRQINPNRRGIWDPYEFLRDIGRTAELYSGVRERKIWLGGDDATISRPYDGIYCLKLKSISIGGWLMSSNIDPLEMPTGKIQCANWTLVRNKLKQNTQEPINVLFAMDPVDPKIVTLVDPKTNSTDPVSEYQGDADITKIDVSSLTGTPTLLTFLKEEKVIDQRVQAHWRDGTLRKDRVYYK